MAGRLLNTGGGDAPLGVGIASLAVLWNLHGDRTRSHRFTRASVEALANGLAGPDGRVTITPSRRTDGDVVAALRARLPGAWVWDGAGDNPNLGLLTLARHIGSRRTRCR